MTRFLPMKALALAASLMLTTTQASEAKLVKPSGGSSSANLVISKVFYAGSKKLADGKNYAQNTYVQLFNNSADTLDLAGLYIAFANSDNGEAAWTAEAMKAEHKDSIVVKQIFQIPAEGSFRLDPAASLVLANCAVDHSQEAEGNVNLSTADFEVKSQNKNYVAMHNENVPELKLFSTFGTTDFVNLLAAGPNGIVLLAADTKLENCPKVFPRGKEKGNEYTIVPAFKTIDCVDIVKQKSPSADDKRMPANYDDGYTCIAATDANNGLAVVRKTAFVTSSGRTVLFDTNNSSVDFESTDDLSLRTYSQTPDGLTDSTIVIPESGYLAICPSKPFCGPQGMVFAYVNGSKNNTDLKYNEYPADSLLLMKGDWIAIAKPGTYNIQLSESQGIVKTRSTSQAWSTDDHKELTGNQKTRSIYKFTNAVGKVGFQRVPATADGTYNVADFTDGNRLYISLTTDIVNAIYAANGAASAVELDFIPWHGSQPKEVTGIAHVEASAPTGKNSQKAPRIYNLAGQQLAKPQQGINIVGGKKFVVK